MSTKTRSYLYASVAPILFGAVSLATTSANAACTGPGAPSNTQTKCLTAVQIPGNPIRSFDISWVNPDRGEYYFSDRSNSGIDVIDTHRLTFKRTIGGFQGVKLTGAGAVNNNVSGPDGVTSHGRWVYAGDGNSTLKVIDLDAQTPIQASIATGGTTRVDEMALTPDGRLLLAANNAEDPPFATLFHANGDSPVNTMSAASIITKIMVNTTIMPTGAGLSLEQPTWNPNTQRYYNSIPIIANNPAGCNYGQNAGAITCHGGVLVIDPTTVTPGTTVYGAYNATTNTGVVPLTACSPNGITLGPHNTMMEACNPGNNPSDVTTLVFSAKTPQNSSNINGITGADEVWFNSGDHRYYLGASKDCSATSTTTNPCQFAAALGVVGPTSVLIEKIPQSANSHSVAADSTSNLIFVPQVAPVAVVGSGGDTTAVGQGICGSSNGCVGVYRHDVDNDHDGDDDHDHDHDGHDH